jgi:chitodextrinase
MRIRRLSAAAAALSLGTALLAAASPPQAGAATPVSVTVNAKEGLATVPDTALGVNDAIWDSQLGTTAVSDRLKSAGVRMIRYPGGSYGDIYHWQDNSAPGGYVAPGTDFDTFMASVRRVGAQPMIIANYGTGTPEEAAAWVKYANVTKGYGAKYWTVGNENYGNGHYGANWEADNHTDKSPTEYANEVVAYADAMKAVDPTVKIGAVLTMPANWPDGLVASGDSATWNNTVLSIAGSKIDFVDVHWYPGGSNPAELLTKPQQLNDALYLLRKEITDNTGGRNLAISFTETNVSASTDGSLGVDTQPGALYLAEAYSGLLANGVFTVDWWDVHNGLGPISTVAGQTDYGDFGILSSGNCTSDGATCEPPLNTPFAPYHALSMMNDFVHPGDQFVAAGTDQSLVTAHAVRRPNGDLAVLLVNKDPDNAQTVSIDYEGYKPSAAVPTVYSYGNGDTSVSSAQSGTAGSQTLPPYSLTTLVLHPASPPAALAAPGQPTASQITDRTATISWPSTSAAKYEIHRQNGTINEELGETSGTSFTVRNLTPGTRYTVNVLARDKAGNLSAPSLPLTFTTGSPATSPCTVRFTDANDWASGYVANLDITNNGPAALNGWTLTYTWPTGWQQYSSGWNATWSQTDRTVKATSVDFNAQLAAGATTSIGLVANYTGPNILPTVFTLNGTVCHTG